VILAKFHSTVCSTACQLNELAVRGRHEYKVSMNVDTELWDMREFLIRRLFDGGASQVGGLVCGR
jgi:hypothetical protein